MKKYEAPQLKFEKLQLFEKIAKQCWAAKEVGFNDPLKGDDNTFEAMIKIKSKDPDCGRDELDSYLDGVKKYYKNQSVYDKWYDANVKGMGDLQNTLSKWVNFS